MCRLHVISRWLCVVGIASLVFLPMPSAAQSHPEGFVYVEDTYLMLNGERFIVKGYNYLPRDYGWTSMADWDWEAVDRDFALAREYGANTIRTGLSWVTATGDRSCEQVLTVNRVRPPYLEAVQKLVGLAEKHDLRLILWLGDLCDIFLDPAYYSGLQKYLESIIPFFVDNPYILAWDLETDIDGGTLQPPPVGGYGIFRRNNKNNMLTMLRRMADTIREMDPHHLITVGFCWPTSSLLAQDFTDFLMPQVLGGDAPNILSSDEGAVLEGYGMSAGTDRDTMLRTLEEKIRYMQSNMTRPMPIVIAEYGSPSAGENWSLEIQRDVYDTTLEVAFLRMKIAGALNWVLTDFTWPPKAKPFAFLDQPLPVTEQNFGAFFLDYSPKPAAEVARTYYADAPTIAFQDRPEVLQFVFNKTFVPGAEDTRVLAAAFDYVSFLDENRTTLLKIDIGDPSARPYLAQGFFDDEGPWGTQAQNFAWAGGTEKTARVTAPFPEGTRAVSFRVQNELSGMQVTVSVDGEAVGFVSLGTGWRTYTLVLPEAAPLTIGETYTIRGKFNLPISEGIVTIQTSGDQITWRDAASVVPDRGRFSAPIPIDHAGTMWLRAVWSGAGFYQQAMSEAIPLEIASPPVTPTIPALPASPSPTPVVTSTPETPIGLYGGVGLLVLLVGIGVWIALRRRKRP